MKRTKTEKFRLGFIFFCVIVFFAVVAARLVQFQIFKHKHYKGIVDKQSTGTVRIPANRGILYDRNGIVVAKNIIKWSLYSNPRDTKELYNTAAYLEKLYGLEKGSAIKTYGMRVNLFRWIDRMLDDDFAEKIEKEAPSGLYLREENQRDYPFDLIGKQFLGFTNIDNKGQSGLEYAFDSIMTGQQGFADYRRDGLRNTYRVKEQALVKPVTGVSLVTTLDWTLQEIVEEELKKGLERYKAKAGMAVFMNNNNGEILAIAYYDPEEKNPYKPVKLRPITDQFEPGSVFKVLTAVGIMEDGVVRYMDTIYCEKGKWKVDGRFIHDDKDLEWINFRTIIEMSSNIGLGKCAIMHGGEKMYQNLMNFNIGSKLDIGWPGEASGQIYRPDKWSDFNVASLSMGHAVAVSPLQIVTAVAAIANGGELIRPRVILGEVDNKGQLINKTEKEVIRMVMSPVTSDSLISFLRGVVVSGTADKVNSEIINIAGKTGTAQIPKEDGSGYYYDRYMASFAGFFPSEKPLITGIVIYENPQPVHYGGWTAGPVFRKIAERYSILNPDLFTVPERQLAKTDEKFRNTVSAPDFVGRTYEQALARAEKLHLKIRTNNDTRTGIVIWQYPKSNSLIFEQDEILIAVKDQEENFKMADLYGLSIREVSAFFNLVGINYKVSGNGMVVKQSIKPGEILNENSECRLVCEPF